MDSASSQIELGRLSAADDRLQEDRELRLDERNIVSVIVNRQDEDILMRISNRVPVIDDRKIIILLDHRGHLLESQSSVDQEPFIFRRIPVDLFFVSSHGNTMCAYCQQASD